MATLEKKEEELEKVIEDISRLSIMKGSSRVVDAILKEKYSMLGAKALDLFQYYEKSNNEKASYYERLARKYSK
ncbi:MAG: hypothetical protein ACP5RP_00395 [Candidatus Micrarchaeia archaeon]